MFRINTQYKKENVMLIKKKERKVKFISFEFSIFNNSMYNQLKFNIYKKSFFFFNKYFFSLSLRLFMNNIKYLNT